MIIVEKKNFQQVYQYLRSQLTIAPAVDVGTWQSQDISEKPEMVTHELHDVHWSINMPLTYDKLVADVKPNLPWAEDHFKERVSGKPLNPPPSEQWWPYAQQGNAEHKEGTIFSHTYPERMWPKFASAGQKAPNGRLEGVPHQGIRYEFGDLQDVVELLEREPMTRQAYLPIWFPEDTGNASNVRVPCSLGYHFMYRDKKLHTLYTIRSCDFMRHFQDDVYMAMRLAEWVAWMAFGPEATVGRFTMVIPSLHIFEGDIPILLRQVEEDREEFDRRLMGAFG